MVRERARLPCDVTTNLLNDRVVLILWYRGNAGTPIYSYDARGKAGDADGGKHWSDGMILDRRAYFQLLPSLSWGVAKPPGAYLEIYPVRERDEATYRCRVDYLLSPTKNTIVNFTVVIPPSRPKIFDESGLLLSTKSGSAAAIIGPYNEGDPLVLVCKVFGGRPPPKVEWLIQGNVRPSEVTQQAGGVIRLVTVIPYLHRSHLHSIFECRASNFEGSIPVSSRVTLDMNFQPAEVSIISSSLKPLSANTVYELSCHSWGSRPSGVISWWKGGTQPLHDHVVTTSSDGNVTTSILKYRSQMTDNGKYLTCRAENALIAHSAKEDSIKLNIFYDPVVTLQIGSTLDPNGIKEGDDVYFECHINANPEVNQIFWYRNGVPVQMLTSHGISIQNQTLVLRTISRESSGLYTCRAENPEGQGESQPVSLRVMYKPYCKDHSKTTYGTALHEPVSVACEVEASPGPVTFRWTFNNTSEHLPIPASAVSSRGLTSVASYAPKNHRDYGTLLCWALNEVGRQDAPCAFNIIAAGPPDPPSNCTITNQTTVAIQVDCEPGFDGGLNQVFHIEVYDSDTGVLRKNLTSSNPRFLLTGLKPGIAFAMVAYAANAKGASKTFVLETFTLKVAEKRTGPPTLIVVTPVMGVLMGIVLMLAMIGLAVGLLTKVRRSSPYPSNEGRLGVKLDLENLPLNVEVLGSRGRETKSVEESNPDIIPHTNDGMSYTDYESVQKEPVDERCYDTAITV